MLVAAVLISSMFGQDRPVSLNRIFAKGEKSEYLVEASLQVESRQRGLTTWMPEDLDVNYRFTTHVFEMGADGIARMKYFRPTVTEVQGETVDSGPKTKVEKLNLDFTLTVSPINEVIEMKDETKKPGKPKGRAGWATAPAFFPTQAALGPYLGEIYRLSAFIGSLDLMDFAPKLPFDQVKVGDTWKRTVSYQPQKVQGKDGKQRVQRLDYTFTYRGTGQLGGKPVHRISAQTALDTDIGEFFNQMAEAKPEETGLKSIPLKLKATIDYDLDAATKQTLSAVATSEGSFGITLTAFSEPVVEERIRGRTLMRLLSRRIVPYVAPKATSRAKRPPAPKKGG